ncbi:MULTISPECIES: hypothetical protein [Cyclobacteriaceae]|uniref:Uncharacterized protein n=2 Tax=Cyclobacteriaceae TaxID=563798 RepID=A0ABV9T0M4_9BACT
MKSIENMTNVDKAKLLHKLFPNEIPGLLTFINDTCQIFKEQEQEISESWDHPVFTFAFWRHKSKSIEQAILQFGDRLASESELFSIHLFEGYRAFFSVDCTVKYAERKSKNPKFKQAVDLLFNFT